MQPSLSNDDTDPGSLSSQAKNKRKAEVTVLSQTYTPNYHSSSSSSSFSSTATTPISSLSNYPPPPFPFAVCSYPNTDFYNISSSSSAVPPRFDWNYIEDATYYPKKKSSVAGSSHHPYYPDPSPPLQPKKRRHRKQPHELLSESQKKANHIASEQKRRQNIRIGFDQLIDIVPSLNHGNRSEALILQKSVDHIRHLVSLKNELKNQVRDLQSTLGENNYEEDSSEDESIYTY